MKTYIVQFKETAINTVAVEAGSYAEAIAKARDCDYDESPEKESVVARNTFKVIRELTPDEIEARKDNEL